MLKPIEPNRPWPPSECLYAESVKKRYIYSYSSPLTEDGDEDVDEEKELPKKPIEEVNLSWLIGEVPVAVKLDQIKIEFGFNAGAMSYEDHYVRFYYEETIPANLEGFAAAQRAYEIQKNQYDLEMKAYSDALKKYEIEQAEQNLARLKGE